MNRDDRKLWASARTLDDLCELTAMWLEGAIASQPGYAANCGPDDETLPLVPVLVALNRAGVMTTGSQPGLDVVAADGSRWKQRAAVEFYFRAHDPAVLRLTRVARWAGLITVAHLPSSLPRWRYRYDQAVTVTRTDGCDPQCPTRHEDGCDWTWFGTQVPRRHIRSPHLGYGICHRDAVKAVCSAWQVTLIYPAWGREDSPLWALLADFAGLAVST